jgi:hypothetical protein
MVGIGADEPELDFAGCSEVAAVSGLKSVEGEEVENVWDRTGEETLGVAVSVGFCVAVVVGDDW